MTQGTRRLGWEAAPATARRGALAGWEAEASWSRAAPDRAPAPRGRREIAGPPVRFDLFRLLVALVGIGVYLGVPIGAFVGLVALID